MSRVQVHHVPNNAKSAINADGIFFDQSPCRVKASPHLHHVMIEPWNMNVEAIMQLQATVVELTQKVWELENRLNALP